MRHFDFYFFIYLLFIYLFIYFYYLESNLKSLFVLNGWYDMMSIRWCTERTGSNLRISHLLYPSGLPHPFLCHLIVGKIEPQRGAMSFCIAQHWQILFFFSLFCFVFSFLALPCNVWFPSSRQGIEPEPPALEVWSLYHWTAGKVPALVDPWVEAGLNRSLTVRTVYSTPRWYIPVCRFARLE